MYTMSNMFDNMSFMCGNNHNPVKMQILKTEKTVFYACPRYFDENREPGEPCCNNALYMNDAENGLSKINSIVAAKMMDNTEFHVKGMRVTSNGVEYKVLNELDDPDGLKIQVTNHKVLDR